MNDISYIFADVEWKAIPLENRSVILEYRIIENDDFFGVYFLHFFVRPSFTFGSFIRPKIAKITIPIRNKVTTFMIILETKP